MVTPELVAARLPAWADRAAAQAWDWPRWNCLLAPADWALALTGEDPAAAWRGRVTDEPSAWGVVAAAGGLVRLARAALEPLGWQRTRQPIKGAVGLVVVERDLCGGVCLGERWLLASSEGVLVQRFDRALAWNPPRDI